MKTPLSEYFRCPENSIRLVEKGTLSGASGYFRFGEEAVCFGKYCGGRLSDSPANRLHDALCDTVAENGTTYLPFDLAEVLDNLRCELYADDWRGGHAKSALATIYYLLRPIIPFNFRSRLKKLHLSDWEKLAFPRWPVDCSVDSRLNSFCSCQSNQAMLSGSPLSGSGRKAPVVLQL